MDEYTVYWYKLKTHTNPFTEGYIGITNNIERRDKEHRRNKKNTHFANAFRKYGSENIEYEVLYVCSKLEALDLELGYRPDTNIGWNSAVGGDDILVSVMSTPITVYHISNPTKMYTYNSIEEASKALDVAAGRLRQAKSRKNNHYGYDGWAILHDPDFNTLLTKELSEVNSKKLLGVKKSKPSMFKGCTNRWTEEQKKAIGSKHKGKVITEKQKEQTRKTHRANHTSCKAVTLIHESNTDKQYIYHSISEASRQLDIPLSRLKSKAQRPLNVFGKDGWAITNLGSE